MKIRTIAALVATTAGALVPSAMAQAAPVPTAYVTNFASGTVTPINTVTNTARSPVTLGGAPNALAITPDGATAYVSDYGSGTVTPITIATNRAGHSITVGSEPYAIAITSENPPSFTEKTPEEGVEITTALGHSAPANSPGMSVHNHAPLERPVRLRLRAPLQEIDDCAGRKP